jgi:hypothetical protein
MPWYRSGTVSVTTGQTTVTGASTDFALNSRVGDAFQGPDGRWYEVANIASSTVLSILPAYQGPTVAAGSYGLAPMQGYVKEAADRLRQLVEQFGSTLALLGTPADAAGLRQNIGAAARGANSDITSLSGLTTALSVSQGGTGGKTQAEARAGIAAQAADATLTELSGTGFVRKFSDNSLLATMGWRRMPDGGINQWGLVALSAVGAFNPQTIGGQTWYTHFYVVTLPTSYVSSHHSVVASLNGAPSYAQSAMTPAIVTTDKRTSSATESLTAFTVAICTPITGWIPYLNFRSCGK